MMTAASPATMLRKARSAARRLARRFPGFAPADRKGAGHSFDLDHFSATHAPFPAFAELRRGGDVHFLDRHSCWIVLGHEAVKEALSRPDFFSSSPQAVVDAVLLGADPPRHEAPRRLVAGHLTGSRIAAQVASARRDAAALVRPSFDLVADFAIPLAHAAAARLVGLDQHELGALLGSSDISLPMTHIASGSRNMLMRSRMFTALRGDGADEASALSLVRLLCRAATETTERLIIRAGAALLGDHGLRVAIDRDPSAVAAFIEEVARLLPPEPSVVRRTTGRFVLANVEIPEDAVVFLSLLAANRDPKCFDKPDSLRLDRGRNPHLSFAGGPHQCIGAGLARQVAGAAIACLADRNVRAANPDAPSELSIVQRVATPRHLMAVT